jgi:hypothetical protein
MIALSTGLRKVKNLTIGNGKSKSDGCRAGPNGMIEMASNLIQINSLSLGKRFWTFRR